ncbi:ricin-type beta-trefoil lectin domain protein [Kitasatospora sp. NPDC004745]|uniref:ricin-type beta-trefoil lectin domain protein n=1 Tax=Kitasatospora sp. NPDC004745 TaxID=3364019 RepID=UPI003696DAF5
MFSVKQAAAVAATAIAVAGVPATAPAAAAAGASAGRPVVVAENVRFFNEETNGALDASSFGPVAVTWEANGGAFQDWLLRPSPRGYLIESVGRRGNCLQAPANPGEPLPVVKCNPNVPTQQWAFDRVGDRVVIGEMLDENYVIEATTSGSPVVKSFRDDNPRQLWDITPS